MSDALLVGLDTAITLDHVSKTYAGGVQALQEVSLSVGRGAFLSVVGPCRPCTTHRPSSANSQAEIHHPTIYAPNDWK